MELSPALLLFWFASLPLIAQSGDKFDVSGILRLTDRPPEATPVEAQECAAVTIFTTIDRVARTSEASAKSSGATSAERWHRPYCLGDQACLP
jgi:hypothetical protein